MRKSARGVGKKRVGGCPRFKMTSFSLFGCFKRHFKDASGEAPQEVKDVFARYAAVNGSLSTEKLLQFLEDVQGESNATLHDAKFLVEHQLGTIGSKLHHGVLDLESFFQLLLSPTLNAPLASNVHHDMNEPLAHYYIYTGHNSYLTGNQLSSKCSVDPIVKALKKGVRAIELDMWPNKNKNKIQVLHGKTLTAPVDFRDCIVAIRDNAFYASEYPVILTLEDHLPSALQKEASTILKHVLGKMLYFRETNEPMNEFPSPESLKLRIIVSTKPPKEYLEAEIEPTLSVREDLEEADKQEKVESPVKDRADDTWGEEVSEFPISRCHPDDEPLRFPKVDSALEVELVKPMVVDERDDTIEESRPDYTIDPDYARLITIRLGKLKGPSMREALIIEDVVKRVSLSEKTLEKVAKAHPEALISFSRRNLVRVYPNALRLNSSNYNPFLSWTHGAQMVALNMQGYGRPLWLVQGFFRANGGCGYIRKPQFLLECGGMSFNPSAVQPLKTLLRVKVIMGLGWLERFGKHYFDHLSPPDFYTRVGIAGVPSDTVMKKTDTIMDDWTPNWNCQFEFPLMLPEIALLRVEVHEYDQTGRDDFAGQTCLPVCELKTGFRCLQLFDKRGDPYAGVRLLVLIEMVPQM